MKMTAAEVASWVGGALEAGREDALLETVSIDSRTTEPDDLFFAIVGPHHDGHRFVGEALARGAAGVVLSGPIGIERPAVRIRVADTTRALQDLASAVRRQTGIKVVAITGSMGKTTTKEAAAAALRARHRVLKSEKNLNNLWGVPLSLLRHRNEDVAVLELGMSAPGEIARLTEITDPDVGVLMNVAEVHRQFFPSLEAIARAKGELFDGLPDGSVAVVNADDALAVAEARRFSGRQIRFGFDERADMRATNLRHVRDGVVFNAHHGSEQAEVRARLYGRHNVYNLLAALAVAVAVDLPLASAANELAGLDPAPHRGERIRFRNGILVIDETYNSNPTALEMVLTAFGDEDADRRIAVLGDMLELGERSEVLHLESGRQAAGAGIDLLIGVGPLGRFIVEGARRAGMPESALVTVDGAEQAGEWLLDRIEAGDVMLFKASRGVGLERGLDILRKHFEMESV